MRMPLRGGLRACYLLHVDNDSKPSAKDLVKARELLHAAAPAAAARIVSIMDHGDKDDAVALSAAEKILSINGIAAKKESGAESAKLVGAAVIAAIAGMAKVAGVAGAEKRLAKAIRDVTPASTNDDIPPELLEQDALV